LAQTEKLDVLHQNHFVVANAESRSIQQVIDVLVIAAGKEAQRFLVTLGRLGHFGSFLIAPRFSRVRRWALRLRGRLNTQNCCCSSLPRARAPVWPSGTRAGGGKFRCKDFPSSAHSR